MTLNFICYDLPYPLTSGGKIRSYQLLKGLCKDYQVTLYSYYRTQSQKKYVNELKKELGLKEIKLYKRHNVWHPINLIKAALSPLSLLSISYQNEELRNDLLVARSQKPEAIFHFEALGPSVYLPTLKKKGAICVFGSENIEWKVYQRMVIHRKFFPLIKPLMNYDVFKLKHYEHKLYKSADLVIAVSRDDCKYIKKNTQVRAQLIRNGVDLEVLKKIKKRHIVSTELVKMAFGGNLVYQQNIEALQWFFYKVYPLMRDEITKRKLVLELDIVSIVKPKWLADFINKEKLLKTSIFNDPHIYAPRVYSKADIFIAPIRTRGGVQIKILEAMAVHTPVVTTKYCARPIEALNGEHLLSDNTSEGFAECLLKLMHDLKLRDKIIKNAYQFVSKNYSWQVQANKLRQIYKNRFSTTSN